MSNPREELISGLKRDFTTISQQTSYNSVRLLTYQVTRALLAGYVSNVGPYPLRFLPTIAADYSILAVSFLFHKTVTTQDLIKVPFRAAVISSLEYVLTDKEPRDWIRQTWSGVAEFLDQHPTGVQSLVELLNCI
jgi:hypothetical protein